MASKEERARQFLPFDALKGFKKAIKDKERVIVKKKELAEDAIESLNEKLNNLRIGIIISVINYENGQYIKTTGVLSKIDLINQYISVIMEKIYFSNIYDIDIDEEDIF